MPPPRLSRRGPTFAAVIGHADDADLLRRCIVHHLAIGVEHIFVSLNTGDAASARVTRAFPPERVRAAEVAAFAPDPFHYFTAAKDVVMDWAAPDWMLFVDSDELWLPAGGSLRGLAGLDAADVVSVPRYNAAPLRRCDGTMVEFGLDEPGAIPVVDAAAALDDAYFARYPDTPLILAWNPPKLMMRPELIAEVGRGAHQIVARVPAPRSAPVGDLLMLHLPFTTEARFRRKLGLIRARFAEHGHRFGPDQAWHWRRWVALDEAGIGAEFARQTFAATEVPALLARGVLTTPARLAARERAACG